ncbi:TPA: zinc metalloprotease HtpX [Streptococcus pyogenes]|nr:zinc metalloprotease HtpX [Streptococcus pyogenes]
MLYQQISQNKQRTVVLLVVFFALLALIGASAGYLLLDNYAMGLVLALVIGVIYATSMIFQSTSLVMSMNNAREVTEKEAPGFFHIVEDMAMVAQIPMPRVFIIEDPSSNAFATGSSPQNAAVAATTGLLEVMNREELEGVIGHEISHIRNYDIRISTISSIGGRMLWYGGGSRRQRDDGDDDVLRIITLLLSLLSLLLAPLVASLIQLAISRQREYLADASSVELTRNPQGMIKALEKLQLSQPMKHPVDDASAALYINEPRKKRSFSSLFSTHPPIEERIERLKNM